MKRLVLLALVLSFAACERTSVPVAGPETDDRIATRDQGELRILYPRQQQVAHLPRRGHALELERDLIEQFARQQQLRPVWVFVESRESLIPSLLEGRGDVIVGNLTSTPERRRQVDFSVPLSLVREQLVTRSSDVELQRTSDLAGRTIALRRSSSFWSTVQRLRQRVPELRVVAVEEDLDTEEIIQRVATGEYDLTVADSNQVAASLEYQPNLRVAFDLTGERPIAWGLRPGSTDLLRKVNRFLVEAHLTDRDQARLDDLSGIRNRKVLRVLTVNSAATYFLWRGRLMGFEYDLVHRLAQDLGVRVEMIVPPEGTDPLDWLREGRGDLVAAGLTARDIAGQAGVALSRPYNVVTEDVVKRSDDLLLTGPHDLRGRRIVVPRDSPYWSTLSQPAARALGYELVAAPDHLTTEQIIHMVADGELDLTLADTHLVDIEGAWRGGVQNAFALSAPVELVWAVRKSNSELLDAVNAYLEQIYRSEFYNVKYEQYFRNPSRVRAHQQERLATLGQFSEWDELVKETAARYGFDWRLILSMMYQESRFDPNARSFAGAEGLMQVLPRTAKQLGFEDLKDPQVAIEAGIMYLDWVRERFEPELDPRERLWFTLAAYNAGPGHVRDARRLAAELGKDPNRWFGHVEEAIQLLAHPDHAQNARYGYCRGTEPVRYVAEVRDRYLAYVTTLAAL